MLTTLIAALGIATGALLSGGDVSEIPEVEASGATYSIYGRQSDPFEIMQSQGWKLVRFRVWNDPKGGWCDEAHTLVMAKRAKAHGLAISLDFHYSDWWADPGKQNKPAAWKTLSFDELTQAVYDYTKMVVGAMVAQGTPPLMVQIGNEIVGGMLWPDGKVDSNDPNQWHRLASLLGSGVRAIHDAQGRNHIQTMIHLDRGGDNKTAVWWFDHILAEGLKFDLIGLSYYPFWHGHLDAMEKNVDDLAKRYGKDIYIVETSYPWRINTAPGERVYTGQRGLEAGYPPTPEGQKAFLKTVCDIVRRIPNGHGRGVLYWAPMWIAPKGQQAPYNNLALFDDNGNALPGVAVLGGRV
jgi:arabinogalactan endo-1,4-beta-galactosidase